jgi:hypothetical protein
MNDDSNHHNVKKTREPRTYKAHSPRNVTINRISHQISSQDFGMPVFKGGIANGTTTPSYYHAAWRGHKSGSNGVDSANRIHFVVRINTRINLDTLSAALSSVVARHDVLRAALTEIAGEPCIQANMYQASIISLYQITKRKECPPAAAAKALASALIWRKFDQREGLYRAFLIRLAAKNYVFGFVLHHFVGDAFSIQLLFRELQTTYISLSAGRRQRLPRPTFQYCDYLLTMKRWSLGKAAKQNLDYWLEKLSAAHALQGQSASRWESKWVRVPFEIASKQVTDLRELAKERRVTLFTVLLAIQMIIVSRLSGHDNVAVAAITSGREIPILRDVIGRFSDRTYYTASLVRDPSFAELLDRVKKTVQDSSNHPFIRFDTLEQEMTKRGICVVAPIFNFRSSTERTITGIAQNPWKPFAIDPPPMTSRLGTSVHYYWLEMWDTPYGLRASLRCQETLATPLRTAFSDIVRDVVRAPYHPLSTVASCKQESFVPLLALAQFVRIMPLPKNVS